MTGLWSIWGQYLGAHRLKHGRWEDAGGVVGLILQAVRHVHGHIHRRENLILEHDQWIGWFDLKAKGHDVQRRRRGRCEAVVEHV